MTDIEEFADPIKIAREIVGTLCALPVSFRVSILLPKELWKLRKYFDAKKISDQLYVSNSSHLLTNYPLTCGNDARDRFFFRNIDDASVVENVIPSNSVIMTQRLPGYVGDYDSAPLIVQASDNLRCFLGACIAVNLCHLLSFNVGDSDDRYFVVHKGPTDNFNIVHTESLPSDLSDIYERLHVISRRKTVSEDTFDRITERRVELLNCIFSSTDHGRRLYIACIWFLRSYTSKKTLNSLLESTIAIEALLGDRATSDRSPLSDLLANRCAFLLGRNIKERDEIIAQFKRIYRLRSNIVHAGKHIIEPAERAIIDESSRLCGRIILRELRLASAGSEEE